jgi:hypothetical protein
MRLGHKRLAVENRRQQITRQLDRLRSQLVKRSPSDYANEKAYKRQLKRSHELISDLEGELLILDWPGEYDELPAAVVADELGLTYEQIRNLIKLGEVAATGKTAHERVCRMELERIITVGVPTLLRLGKEEPADIFERAIPHLQNGDLEGAKRAHRRLEARQSWRGPYAPAFLVGLELASGELDGALSSVKLIYEYEDPLRRIVVMTYLGRLLRGMALKDSGTRELRDQLIMLAEGTATKIKRIENQPKQPRRKRLGELQQQAIYLTTSVVNELLKHQPRAKHSMFDVTVQTLDQEVHQIIQDAIYTALYAEFFYEESSMSRIYADMLRAMIPKSYRPANLLKSL